MSSNRNRNRNRPSTAAGNPNHNGADAPENATPVHKIGGGDPFAGIEREPLFEIDGTVFTIPVEAPSSVIVMAHMVAHERGPDAALSYAMWRMLGDRAMAALQACATLTDADLRVVIDAVTERVLPTGQPAPKATPAAGANGGR